MGDEHSRKLYTHTGLHLFRDLYVDGSPGFVTDVLSEVLLSYRVITDEGRLRHNSGYSRFVLSKLYFI